MNDIESTNTLDDRQRSAVRALSQRCAGADRFRTELYSEVETPVGYPAHWYVGRGADMVGYVGLFGFELDAANVVGLVEPDERRRGLFRAMWDQAEGVARRIGLARLSLVVPEGSHAGREVARRLGALRTETEYEMVCRAPAPVIAPPGADMRPTERGDVPLLARLDADSFDSNVDEVAARFAQIAGDSNRRAWIVEEAGTAVGKIHARRTPDGDAVIHDLCIVPAARRRGLGRWMVAAAARALSTDGAARITLDVAVDNRDALGVYQACGFEVAGATEYWTVGLIGPR